ncbi:MAG: DUF4136 domain-containing protein [Polaromonas sp.]|nr:DUF4136 domain-containing protein [Polaromonas sp.]
MTGCTTVRLVDSDVTAFSRWSVAPPGPGTPYRFERLPSQQVMGTQQDQLEALARAALARVGMELNPATARLSVQVMFNTQIVERWPSGGGWYDGFGFPMSGFFLEGGSRGAALGLSFPMRFPEPYYQRELSILMRDLGSGELVFETRAAHDGVWSDTVAVLPAMLDAALLGFPQPMSGTRRVNIETPR